jgi:hypothetical protein
MREFAAEKAGRKAREANIMTVNKEDLEVSVHVTLRQKTMGGQGIQLLESTDISVSGFLEACEILAQFHKILESLKRR